MTLLRLKLALLLLTWAVGWLSASIPLRWAGQPFGGRWIGGGNAFAAGLFLAIGMLHLLPEASAGFRASEVTYPTAALLALVAFLVMLLLEHVLLPEAAHSAVHAHSGDALHEQHDHGSDHRHPHGEGTQEETLSRPYLLVLALSVHSVFAGLGLGTQGDVTGAGLTFAAIAVHKATAGLALGMAVAGASLAAAQRRGLIALFAAMTPLGIAIGLVGGGRLAGGLFAAGATALAAGTFLYIGTFDLLQDEFLRPGRRWAKWVFAALGMLVAALLGTFE